jgi:hypothetical protein
MGFSKIYLVIHDETMVVNHSVKVYIVLPFDVFTIVGQQPLILVFFTFRACQIYLMKLIQVHQCFPTKDQEAFLPFNVFDLGH